MSALTALALGGLVFLGVAVPSGLVYQIVTDGGWSDQANHFAAVDRRYTPAREALMAMSPRPRLGYFAGPVDWQSDSWHAGYFHAQFVIAPIPMTYEASQRLLLANFADDAKLDAAIEAGGYRVLRRFGSGLALLENPRGIPPEQAEQTRETSH